MTVRWPSGPATSSLAAAYQSFLNVGLHGKPLFGKTALKHTVRLEVQHKADAQV